MPWGLGVVPASITSILTNGWEAFWSWGHRTVCVQLDGRPRRCWEESSLADPLQPPGWVQVLMPWAYADSPVEWLVTSVPVDVAAGLVAAAITWCVLRPFDRHHHVDVLPFD